MKGFANRLVKGGRAEAREMLTEAYEVRAFRDEDENIGGILESIPDIPHAETGAFQAIKGTTPGHGEQLVLPDDCQFGDNDLCYVEA